MPDSKSKILFIHHSTGANLLKEGHLREVLYQKNHNLELWDHSYNLYPVLGTFFAKFTYHTGLSDQAGRLLGQDYQIKLSNNSPKQYADIFSSDSSESPLKDILQYDIIAFKNCYPRTKITSQLQLETFQNYYDSIRNSIKKYPTKKFILMTPPPLRKSQTNQENAARALELVNWLISDAYRVGYPNLYIFNFFGFLADQQGFLRKAYCRAVPTDSHPNKLANETIAPLFADFLISVAGTH